MVYWCSFHHGLFRATLTNSRKCHLPERAFKTASQLNRNDQGKIAKYRFPRSGKAIHGFRPPSRSADLLPSGAFDSAENATETFCNQERHSRRSSPEDGYAEPGKCFPRLSARLYMFHNCSYLQDSLGGDFVLKPV